MSQTCIGVLLELATGRVISRHTQRGRNMDTFSLTDADIAVARKIGINLKDVAALKYAHGRGGLNGIGLFSDGRSSNPFGVPDSVFKYVPTNPGENYGPEPRLTDDDAPPTRTLFDPAAGVEVGIVFPDGSTSVTKRSGKGGK
jgi:hypothetical protein